MSATPGTKVGEELLAGYEVVDHLSRGRRLDVYDVWSAERGARCVVKCIRPEREQEERARILLAREGELLMRFTHPHLVRAYEVHSGARPAIVMETLSGETLAHLIEQGRELSAIEIGHLAMHLGSAVRYLHLNGVLHLDLKPANVVAEGGRAKLFDLSVARAPGPADAGIGTPDFMAPEQARGGELGAAADVWGIGIVLHEILTGERAFGVEEVDPASEGEEGDATSWSTEASWETGGDADPEDYGQLFERAPLLADHDDVPVALARLVDDCLDPDPAARPSVESLLARAERLTDVPSRLRRWS